MDPFQIEINAYYERLSTAKPDFKRLPALPRRRSTCPTSGRQLS